MEDWLSITAHKKSNLTGSDSPQLETSYITQAASLHVQPNLFLSRPINFSLVLNDFGVKYVGEENAWHLIESLKEYFTI